MERKQSSPNIHDNFECVIVLHYMCQHANNVCEQRPFEPITSELKTQNVDNNNRKLSVYPTEHLKTKSISNLIDIQRGAATYIHSGMVKWPFIWTKYDRHSSII